MAAVQQQQSMHALQCMGPYSVLALFLLTASAIWLQARVLPARQQQPPREARTAERYELCACFFLSRTALGAVLVSPDQLIVKKMSLHCKVDSLAVSGAVHFPRLVTLCCL